MIRAIQAWARHRHFVRALSLLGAIASPVVAFAEPLCAAPRAEARAGHWPSPLGRLVTLHARDVSLRDALDRLAAAATLRLSYSPELLALERRVCVSYDSMPVGAVLSDLLSGSAVAPVVAGTDQVVLAPATGSRSSAQRAQRNISVLDRVVVTGSPVGAPQRGVASAITVIDRSELARQGGASLSQTLNGAVPGVWLWEQSPSDLLARYGSLRGASSFELSAPKVYIDGIEVANPLLLTELSPDAVERVEVIRGPQGAALYGADAIGGVINVVMRHDNGDGEEVAQLRSSAGLTHSSFVSRPAIVQDHTLSLRGGSDLRSGSLSVSLGSVGSYLPGAESHEARGDGEFKLLGTRSMLTGTARLYAKDAGVGTSPLFSASTIAEFGGAPDTRDPWHGGGGRDMVRSASRDISSNTQSLREYTLGGTATFTSSETWTHALTVGIDGYRLSGDMSSMASPVPTAADSALRAAWGGSDRATIRANSVARVGNSESAAATMTFGADYSTVQQTTGSELNNPLGGRAPAFNGWQGSGGAVAQLDASWQNALFATAGLRIERDDGLIATNGMATLPMIGGAAVHEFGPVTTKLRASYGTAIRPVGSVLRSSWSAREALVQGALAPEEQKGIEAGLDAFVGRTFAIHLTRFDQTAYNLIQPVAVPWTLTPYPDQNGRLAYALQNLGEISNRGWELESSIARGAFSLTGTASFVDSRVRRLATGYTGDLASGDRMLGVPSKMAGMTSAWTTSNWSASFTITRAFDWLNYDGIALATAWGGGGGVIVGKELRQYWRLYPGVTRIDASFSRQLFGGFGLLVGGHNLLDAQRGEPDNVTVLPGRTLTAGLQAKF